MLAKEKRAHHELAWARGAAFRATLDRLEHQALAALKPPWRLPESSRRVMTACRPFGSTLLLPQDHRRGHVVFDLDGSTLPGTPFSPEDIEPAGHVPGTTAIAYTVSRDGEIVGRVHAPQAPGWLNAGEDPREHIARRLNGIEESEGFERLASALGITLDLG